ncbi:MAG: hypothetical protein FJ145_21910 [Deltaproteobacteria bacterium]|nr:hypothetical protein [Deltaproteobacteria bacterium]
MAEPAKLEFLTRNRESGAFKTLEIDSSQVYLQFRPKRLPPADWELRPQPRGADGKENFVLRSTRRDRYLLLNEREYFLWLQFDGAHSLSEIGRGFHHRFGAFDYAIIGQFIGKLHNAGLIEDFGERDLRTRGAGFERGGWFTALKQLARRWQRLSFRLSSADRYCAAVYRGGGFLLFNWFALGAIIALTIAAMMAASHLWREAKTISARLVGAPWLSAGTIAATLLLVSVLHVSVHALACKAYGRRVREIGFFLLQGVLPTFYADVTDIFMASRKARIVVDLAGPLVEVVAGSAAFLGAYYAPPGVGQSLLFAIGIVLWEGALLNLYPFNFLEMDGYNVLADLLAMPALRQQALGLLSRHATARSERRQAVNWIHWAYLVLCFLSALVYVVLHLDMIGITLWKN